METFLNFAFEYIFIIIVLIAFIGASITHLWKKRTNNQETPSHHD